MTMGIWIGIILMFMKIWRSHELISYNQCRNTSAQSHNNIYGPVQPVSTSQVKSSFECCETAFSANATNVWYFRLTDGHSKGDCKVWHSNQVPELKTGHCSSAHSNVKCTSSFLSPPSPPSPPAPSPAPSPLPPPESVSLTIDSTEKWNISQYLASMSLVYTWAPDRAYANGTMAAWAKENKLHTARYPAGTASYFNWENPTGQMGNSSLSRNWIDNHCKPAPKEDWMSLKEYLKLCSDAGLRPLIGVNYNCHNYQKCNVPLNESIARAVRQVEFVTQQGFRGAFWYIGNEDSASKPANTQRIVEHVKAMKAVDPTLKALWNDNGISPDGLIQFLNASGKWMDGVEFHGKWPYGGTPKGFPNATLRQFLHEVPLLEHKSGQSWGDKIGRLRKAAVAAGRPDLILANNEYGLGKPNLFLDGNFTRYTRALVVVELALDMYASGYDIAAFWDNGDGGQLSMSEHMLLDSSHDYRMNPMHLGLTMLSRSTAMRMLALHSSSARVHGFAAKHQTTNALEYYLINKFEVSMPVVVRGGVKARTVQSMVDSRDHWGALVTSTVNNASSNVSFTLPPLSFSRIY